MKYLYFVLGFISACLLFVLVAAREPGPPNYGRYQISAWAGRFTEDTGGVGAFVVDTVTGETRTVYIRVYGKAKGRTVVDNLGKPFISYEN